MQKIDTEKQEQFEYFVDEDKRTVVAVLRIPSSIVADEIINILNKSTSNFFSTANVFLENKVLIDETYRGKATCHPEDEFDIEKGMKIAKKRALRSYYKARTKITENMVMVFRDALNRMYKAHEHNVYSLCRFEKE